MENINLIRKIAWSFHKTTGLDWDDLFQEAALAYLEAMNSYDSEKSKSTTYAWMCMSSHLQNYLKRERRINSPLVDLKEACRQPSQRSYFWERIPIELCPIVEMIIKNPHQLESLRVHDNVDKEEYKMDLHDVGISLRNLLREEGYDRKTIDNIIKTLRRAFS